MRERGVAGFEAVMAVTVTVPGLGDLNKAFQF